MSVALLGAVFIAGPAGGASSAKHDRVPPTPPQNLHVTAATPSLVFTAWEPAQDDVGVVGYYVYSERGRSVVSSPAYTVRDLQCGESSEISVIAYDKARNRSPGVTATVSTAACPDIRPPSTPAGFRQAATTQDAVVLAWNASTDDTGVVGYGVYRNLVRVASPVEPTVTLSGLTCGSTYAYAVDAADAAGNRSALGTAYVQTASCGDGQPPSAPTNLALNTRTATSLSFYWTASNDNVGVAGYRLSLDGQPVTTVSQPSGTLSALLCGTSYTVGVDAYDAAGNRSPAVTVTAATDACPPPPPSGDTSPPSTPTGLSASNVSTTGVTLMWNASSDNVGVTGYDVHRNGTKMVTVSSTTSSQTGLSCGASYSFAVIARDAAGNASQQAQLNTSTAACSSPPPPPPPPPPTDSTPPSQPVSMGISGATRTSVSLTWGPSTDNVAVAGYRTYVNGSAGSTTPQPGATISGLTCGTAYTFEVDAYDAASNRSTKASVIGSTAACPDTQPPTPPTNIVAISRTATSIALSWSASSDNVGVAGYALYRMGAQVGTSSSPTGIFSGLICNTNYTLAVDAYDAAGNSSPQTVVMVSTTACPDTTPPSAPTGLAASNVTQTSLTLTWNTSNDNVGVTGYDVYRNGTKMANVTSSSSTQNGLACAISYTFGIEAYDAAGNHSSRTQLSASTAACSPPPPPPPPPPPTSGIVTGTHWANTNEFQQLKDIGYGFVVKNVAPGDLANAKSMLDTAHAAGIKMIIGLYDFGGPAPYTYTNGQWGMTQAARDTIDYLESRSSDIIAFFGFNEPYWISAITGQENPCGATTAAQLRSFRNMIRSVWPTAKIFHDIGHPAGWAPGGYLYNAHSCIGNTYADATGVADYVGIYDYPFMTTGYNKAQGIDTLNRETNYVVDKMGAIPVWLGQTHATPPNVMPTAAQLKDWNCTIRSLLPTQALISWYVWTQEIYSDYLSRHPELWPLTTQTVCT